MFTARTMMFSWLPACLEHSASPTFLCCSSCAHEPSQAKVGAKRNLAKALAAGTREAGSASGRTSDNGRSPSRSRSLRRAVPLHAAWKHDNVCRAAPKIQREGFVRQRPRRIPQPRAASVPPEQDQRAGGFQRVCGSASFWSAVCGRCCGTGAAKTPTL